MNYCTKCGSLYAQPGTCNCFAVVGEQTIVMQTLNPLSAEVMEELAYQLDRGGVLKAKVMPS